MPLRLIIMAHFDRRNMVDDHVITLAKALSQQASHMLVVSTSDLPAHERAKFDGIAELHCRENIGYDFCSWRYGLEHVKNYDVFDEIVICNDSVYGPIYDLGTSFQAMEKSPADIWGMTSNRQFGFHLQSYFLVFRKSAIHSHFFEDFWNNVVPQPTKLDVVLAYEVGLSHKAQAAGLRLDTYYKPSYADALRLRLRHFTNRKVALNKRRRFDFYNDNQTHILWDGMLRHRIPFVKVDLFRDNPIGLKRDEMLSTIRRHSRYDVGLIERHIDGLAARGD